MPRRKGIGRSVVVGISVVVTAVAIAGIALLGLGTTLGSPSTSQAISTIQSTSSNSCSGYPPGGDCLTSYAYTFTISVNYSGPWKMTYQGYNSLGRLNPTNVSGGFNGTGSFSTPVTLSGLDNNGLTLCAQAQKLDASNSTLVLTITGYNETSQPYGSVTYCGGVAP